jgi:3-oxoacyl-[acyl-carrier-protein] synthase III
VSSSVPIALADAQTAGLLPAKGRILLCAFGLGFSNGLALLTTGDVTGVC